MGGSALLIYGNVAEARLGPRPVPRTLLDRLLGRERTETPAWRALGSNRRMIDVPASALEPLVAAFRQHTRERFPAPWAATRWVLDYLDGGVISLHVRGDADNGQPAAWYVQLTFSGCAGMTQVSSELAVHWAAEWYRREQADLHARFLTPFGFEPTGRLEPEGGAIFVPVGAAGYAWLGPTAADAAAQFDENVDVDAAFLDALTQTERDSALSRLGDEIRRLRPDRCLCQLCAPDLDVSVYDRLWQRP